MSYVPMKALCGHHLDFYVSSELFGCCLQQQNLVFNLRRATYSLGLSLGCLGIPMGPLWSQDWKFHLVTRDVQLGLGLPHYFAVSFRLPSYYKYTLGIYLLYKIFILVLKRPWILAFSHCIPSLVFLSLPQSPLDSSVPNNSIHPWLAILFPFPREIYLSPNPSLLISSWPLWFYRLSLSYHWLNR